MSLQFVIAKYNENINWINNLQNVIVYNKGASNSLYITLPNVGREGHTFAHHIVENYDNLSDFTCFLQGNPFDHSPNLFEIINTFNKTNRLTLLSKYIITCSLNGCIHHHGIPLRSVYTHLFNDDHDKSFIFGAGAQCIVSKEAILSRPKEFYIKIRDLLAKSINPIEGFVIERLWGIIFDEKQCYV